MGRGGGEEPYAGRCVRVCGSPTAVSWKCQFEGRVEVTNRLMARGPRVVSVFVGLYGILTANKGALVRTRAGMGCVFV